MQNIGYNSNDFNVESIIDVEDVKIWARQREIRRKQYEEQTDAAIVFNRKLTKVNLILVMFSIVGTILALGIVVLFFGAKVIFGTSL